mgnify:CR=1 FL=1
MEDYINNWKKYFKPVPIGDTLLICPSWEKCSVNSSNRTILQLDPGLAFGTGTHETTRLCLELLEKYINSNVNVLDVGCGSGILSIASILLGAESVTGVDIDELAVKTALENAKINNIENTEFIAGDTEIVLDDLINNYGLYDNESTRNEIIEKIKSKQTEIETTAKTAVDFMDKGEELKSEKRKMEEEFSSYKPVSENVEDYKKLEGLSYRTMSQTSFKLEDVKAVLENWKGSKEEAEKDNNGEPEKVEEKD